MTTIRTKWHKLLELLDAGEEVYTPAPVGGHAEHISEFGTNLDMLRRFYRACSTLPKFVVDFETLSLVLGPEGQHSILDMQKANVLRLPFPAMVMEIPLPATATKQHLICILRDTRAVEFETPWIETGDRPEFDFYGIIAIIHQDQHGEYLVISPAITYVSVNEMTQEEAVAELTDEGADARVAGIDRLSSEERAKMASEITGSQAWLKFLATPAGWLPDNPENNKLIASTYEKTAHNVGRAIFASLLLMMTRGMEREVIDVERLNKQRVKNGKPPIPHHTYIRIGSVYQSDGSTKQYDERKSPRPHWRRGHIRNYRTKGGGTRPRYIPPMLVAYHGAEIAAELAGVPVPDYVVKK